MKGCCVMNWKKFFVQCDVLCAWLSTHTQETEQALLRIVGAILSGVGSPARAVYLALHSTSLCSLLTCSAKDETELSDDIYDVLMEWIAMPLQNAWLGKIYEQRALGRRVQGLYYTPPEIIDFILSHTVAESDVLKNPYMKILDPACGCGYFLIKAYELLFDKYQQAREQLMAKFPGEWSDRGIHNHILIYNLWGADIDECAADIACFSLMLKAPTDEEGVWRQPNILVCDSLNKCEQGSEKHVVFWSAQYDYVIGNPPYLSFGLRGAGKLDVSYRDYLRETYQASAEYKLSYYVLFVQRGIESLKHGGKLGFIMPDSLLTGRYFSKIRSYLLEHTLIEIIAVIKSQVFPRVTGGFAVVYIITREQDEQDTHKVNVYGVDHYTKLAEAAVACSYPQRYWNSLIHKKFRVFFNLEAKNIVDYMDHRGEPLANFVSGHTGIRALAKQSDIVAKTQVSDTWQPGLVSGSQIHRYVLCYENDWLHIDPRLLYKGGWQTEIVKSPKMLVKQTSDSLIACIDIMGLYHLNNIHSFICHDKRVCLEYILLLFNSRLLSFYYHMVTMEYGRSMAQTDIETLESLPIVFNAEVNRQAVELVTMMNGWSALTLQKDANAQKKVNALDDYINQLVYRIYNISDKAMLYIEKYENELTVRKQK